jgi:hypothetical protein
MKKIDINWTLYETLEKYPELEDVLYSLGFEGVKNSIMRNTHAKTMKLKKGIEFLKIDKKKMKEKLNEIGFDINLED